MQFLIMFSVIVLLIGLIVQYPTDQPKQVKFYTVNLDIPEEKRWIHIMEEYAYEVKYMKNIIKKLIPKELIPLIETIAMDIDSYLEAPYANEMIGIANAMNISLGDVVILNLYYEATAYKMNNGASPHRACTSIVLEDEAGQIWHARNLDFGFGDILRNVTIGVHFQKNGKTVYSVITFAGYVGAVTGQKPNAFTVTVDERDQGPWIMNILMGVLDRNAVPISFLVRDTLANFGNYSAAVDHLAQTDTIASAYFIVGGVEHGEGVVITKSRIEFDDIWHLGAEQTYPNWFLVETNYDHWKPAPSGDDRRDYAIKAMQAMGRQNISVKSLFNVISTPPVKNNSTVYSIVMSAAQPSLMAAYIRYPQ